MSKKQPDISHHHPVKDWGKVKDNVDFLISKATQGTDYVDPTLDSFIKGCEGNGIPYWLYSFLEAGDGKAQAKYLIDKCKGKVGAYFVGYIIDAEKDPTTGKRPTDAQASSAIKYLKAQGVKCGLYTGYADYSRYKDAISEVKGQACCFWWEARYGENNGSYNSGYPCNKKVDLHQFTSEGSCAGISGSIDLNRITGQGKDLAFFKATAPAVVKAKQKPADVKATEKTITICGHGSGCPSTKTMYTYLQARYQSKAPNGKRKGVVKVMRFKKMTDAGRKKFHNAYQTLLGRNYYSQLKRKYVFKKASDGKYYSDCSSSGMAAYQKAGYDVELLNTAGIYRSSLFEEVPVKIKNGHITNPEILKVADAILFVGSDPSRPLQIGHVEFVYEISGKTAASTTTKKESGGGVYKVEFGLLKNGTKSKQVNTFELCMKAKGYYDGKIDGDYGAKCKAACKKIQKKHGLTQDGECGPKTWPYVLGLK